MCRHIHFYIRVYDAFTPIAGTPPAPNPTRCSPSPLASMTKPKGLDPEKINDGRPFFWQDKERTQIIMDNVPRRQLRSVLAVYFVLTFISNGEGARFFGTYLSTIAERSGLSPRMVRYAILTLRALNLIIVTFGKRADSFTFTKLQIQLTKGAFDPSTIDQDALSQVDIGSISDRKRRENGSKSDPISRVVETRKQENKKTINPPNPPSAGVDRFSGLTETMYALSVRAMKDNPNYANHERGFTRARDLVRDFGEELSVPALAWSVENAKTDAFGLARTKLAAGEHPWVNSPPNSAPPSPKSPMEKWLSEQQIYRDLKNVNSRTVQEEKMRGVLSEHAPDLDINIQAIQPADFVLALYRHRGFDIPAADAPST